MEPSSPGRTQAQRVSAGREVGAGTSEGSGSEGSGSEGSGSEGSSGASSGSEGSGSEDSSGESDSDSAITARPVFIKKKAEAKAPPPPDSAAALAKAEHLQNVHTRTSESVPFDGVDDTDDVNPEAEYEQWQARERQRRARDAEALAVSEQAKEDFLRRKRGQLQN